MAFQGQAGQARSVAPPPAAPVVEEEDEEEEDEEEEDEVRSRRSCEVIKMAADEVTLVG